MDSQSLDGKGLSLRKGFKQDTTLSAVSIGLFGLTKVGFNIIVSRSLNIETAGIVNLALSSAFVLAILVANLFTISLTKLGADARGRGDEAEFDFIVSFSFWGITSISAVLVLASFIAAPMLSSLLGIKTEVLRWATPLILLYNEYTFFKSLSYVTQQVARYTYLEIVSTAIFFVTLLVCLGSGDPSHLLIPSIAQFGFFAVSSALLFKEQLRHVPSVQSIRLRKSTVYSFVRYSAITGVGTTTSMWTPHVLTMILGKIAGLKTVGMYAVIVSIVDPLNFVSRVLGLASFPRIAYLYGKREYAALVDFVHSNSRRLFIALVVLGLLGVILSPIVVELALPESGQDTVVLFALMVVSRLILIAAVFHIGFLSGTHSPEVPNFSSPVALLLAVLVVVLWFGSLDVYAIGLAVLVSELTRSVPSFVVGERLLKRMVSA